MPSGTRIELSTEDFDLTEDILEALGARRGRAFPPSRIARMVGGGTTTRDVHRVLPALVADGNVSTTDQGARSLYAYAWGYWQS